MREIENWGFPKLRGTNKFYEHGWTSIDFREKSWEIHWIWDVTWDVCLGDTPKSTFWMSVRWEGIIPRHHRSGVLVQHHAARIMAALLLKVFQLGVCLECRAIFISILRNAVIAHVRSSEMISNQVWDVDFAFKLFGSIRPEKCVVYLWTCWSLLDC